MPYTLKPDTRVEIVYTDQPDDAAPMVARWKILSRALSDEGRDEVANRIALDIETQGFAVSVDPDGREMIVEAPDRFEVLCESIAHS